jgi:arabinofuranosyltransferase
MTWLETLRSRKLIVPMLAIFIALLVQTSWVEEDAFITLRTSYNFIHGYGLRWNIDERVQTFTNPLWMFILSGAHALIANPYITLILVSIIISSLALFVLLIYIPQNNFGLLLAFAVLILSKSFVDFSTSGLENPATHLLAVSFVALYFKAEKPLSDKNLFFLSLLAGLATFNRMDTLLFYLPALIILLRNQFNKRTFLIMLAGFSPFILWEIFSVIYYGFPVPNTYYAKLNTGVPLSEEMTQGILYFLNSLGWDPITLTITLSALTLTFINKRRDEILIALGVVFYLGYIIYIGGDFMSGRFFSAPLILSVALLVRRAEDSSSLEKYIWISLVLLLGLLLAPLKSFANPLESDLVTFDNTSRIADERVGYYRFSNILLFSRKENLTLHPFAQYGLQLRKEQPKVTVLSGIGMAGYFAGPKVHIVDELALGDPLLSHLPISNPADWDISHFQRDIPDGYIQTLESGNNQIADSHLAAYYDKLHLIISGNLWTVARWEAIWKMNTGQYQYLLDAYVKAQQ